MIGVAERENKTSLLKRLTGKLDVMLTVCTHRTIDIDVMQSIMNLAKESRHSFTWGPVRGDALIERARNRAASYFLLECKEDVLLFIDDDVVFEPKDAIKLIDNVMNGADICSGVYIQKGVLGKTWVQFDGQEIEFSKTSAMVEVEAVPTGFLAIKRKVLEKLSGTLPLCHPKTLKFYPFFTPLYTKKSDTWVHLGEDYAFCYRARESGFKVFLDPSLLLGHKGEYIYNMADKVRPARQSLDNLAITLK